jgi:ATP-dependent RNA helicase DDX35
MTIAQQRQMLPIAKYRESILYAVEKYRTVVIVGETGSGKTTQLPQYFHEAGWSAGGRVVVCTQPRRVACISVASRIADEMGASLGREVGYCVRFDARLDPAHTRIKVR